MSNVTPIRPNDKASQNLQSADEALNAARGILDLLFTLACCRALDKVSDGTVSASLNVVVDLLSDVEGAVWPQREEAKEDAS